jgi:hypothetical protein
MLCGAAAVAVLWLLVALVVYRPIGIELPLGMPVLGLVAMLAMLQAIAWAPFGMPGARVLAGGFLGPAPVLTTAWAALVWQWKPAELAMLLAAFVALAYCLAVLGVARDRRGSVLLGPGLLEALAGAVPWPRMPLGSAAGAQRWYELRTKGLLVPGMVALLLGLCLAVTLLRPAGSAPMDLQVGALAFFSPLWMGLLASGSFPKSRFWQTGSSLRGFQAVRPVCTGDLHAALLQAGALSLLAAWLLSALLAPVWVLLSGNGEAVLALAGRALEGRGALGAAALVALGCAGLYALSVGLLASGMTAGLTGRIGVVVGGSMLRTLGIATLVLGGDRALSHLAARPGLLGPAAAVALAAKLLLAAAAFRAALRLGLVRGRTVAWLAGMWLAGAVCLYAAAVLFVPEGLLPLPVPQAALAGPLLLPLLQPALGPLALDWNRHR